MQIIKSYLTKNPCYTANRKIVVKGLMLHSVGVPQPKASVFINSWNSPNFKSACVHGFIDAISGTIYNTLPWNHRGWHGASGRNGSCNNTHIGVEMCEPDCIKYTGGANFTCSDLARAKSMATKTYKSAVELFAYLCKEYNLNPLKAGVVIGHNEGYALGIASNHSDPEHLWKGLGLGYTMAGFRQDVKNAMQGAPAQSAAVPYKVKVNIANLNIRSGAGTQYTINGTTGKGVFTIVDEADGRGASKWGKLKSGQGWISLDYVIKL